MDVLSGLGGPDAEATIDSIVSEGAGAVERVLAFVAGESDVDLPHGGTRGFFEDVESLLRRLARAHPDRFEAELEARPGLRSRFPVISAMGDLASARATGWLLDALEGGDGSCRWLALTKLLERRAPEVVPRLRALLRDRDHLVGFDAACALRVHGGPEDVPDLEAYMKGAQIGGQEYARDSIEAICARAGVPLPATHPGPRLVSASVQLASADEAVNEIAERSQRVAEGEEVAESATVVLRAPEAGVLIGLDREDTTLTATIRRLPDAPPEAG